MCRSQTSPYLQATEVKQAIGTQVKQSALSNAAPKNACERKNDVTGDLDELRVGSSQQRLTRPLTQPDRVV